MFSCCCDGNKSHAVTFFTSRSNKYAGWKIGLKSSTRGPFTRLPDRWPGLIRGYVGVLYRKMLYVLHTHTLRHTQTHMRKQTHTHSLAAMAVEKIFFFFFSSSRCPLLCSRNSLSRFHVTKRKDKRRRERGRTVFSHHDGIFPCA